MIEVGHDVLVKDKDIFNRDVFPPATVLQIAKNASGKRIYKITHGPDSEGYWVDGSRVFEFEKQPRFESLLGRAASSTSERLMLVKP